MLFKILIQVLKNGKKEGGKDCGDGVGAPLINGATRECRLFSIDRPALIRWQCCCVSAVGSSLFGCHREYYKTHHGRNSPSFRPSMYPILYRWGAIHGPAI